MAEGVDPGFVLDPFSGLYYHASSGFYYDAKAAWYYNTHDGQYYMFKDDAYVPLAASDTVDIALPGESNQAVAEIAVGRSSHEEEPGTEEATAAERQSLPSADFNASHPEVPGLTTTQEACAHEGSKEVEVETNKGDMHLRWYSDWPSEAGGQVESLPGTLEKASSGGVPTNSLEERNCGIDGGDYVGEPEETRPASIWIEEALTELYLQNNLGTATNGSDPQAFIDSASQYIYYQLDSGTEHLGDTANEYNPIANYVEETLQDKQYQYRNNWQQSVAWDVDANYQHATTDNELYESDDESEELEEGEWRPEENKKENSDSVDFDEELEEGEICEEQPVPWEEGSFRVDGESSPTHSVEDHAEGQVSVLEDNEDVTGAEHSHLGDAPLDGQGEQPQIITAEEEQWRAQYSQVTKLRVCSYDGSIDLWDWTTVLQEKKVAKRKSKRRIIRLVGRLASSTAQVHPSLGGSGGLIRTTPVCEVDHDFVKVTSGRIYKLQRPSSKYLSSSSPGYVSSNPTQNWGFPLITIKIDEYDDESGECPLDTTSNIIDAIVVSKPFVPNSGHWKYRNQPLTAKKKIWRPILEDSLRTLTKEEITEVEERKQRYRDRAAERRILHKGFGIGPGQKGVSVHELEKKEAEAATEMPAALAKAAAARPIGKDNIGKRMLEGMGWKEGQSLGPGEGGIANPILALGNTGRTGLGWS